MSARTDVPGLAYRHRQGLACGIPLGGLGAGSVELRDDGRFHAWELFNNYPWSGSRDEQPPEMWSEDAFFALRVRPEGGRPRVRLLHHEDCQTDTVSPSHDQAFLYNYPFLRNIPSITYRGRHPFALLGYEDESLPVKLSLEAFSPLIPHNARDSALPLAFFAFSVRNTGDVPCDISLTFSMRNCTGYDLEGLTLRHSHVRAEQGQMVVMSGEDLPDGHRTAGSMAVGALGDGLSHLPAWTAGRGLVGFDIVNAPACSQFYYVLRDEGTLPGGDGEDWRREIARRHADVEAGTLKSPKHKVGWCWRGAVCRKLTLAPGEEGEVVFLLAWFYPNHCHYGFPEERLGHMYENWFDGAEQVARYGMEHFGRLREESRAFRDHLFGGNIEPHLAATLNAQLTTFPKSFWWTQDGEMSLWEGQSCCQYLLAGRTVWSSWQPLALFPDVYTDMVRRMAEFRFEEGQEEDSPLIGL
ncbi:MAG: GH116 family glycosyl-hydrolase, partial [Candidatus Brocadiia bacterium]